MDFYTGRDGTPILESEDPLEVTILRGIVKFAQLPPIPTTNMKLRDKLNDAFPVIIDRGEDFISIDLQGSQTAAEFFKSYAEGKIEEARGDISLSILIVDRQGSVLGRIDDIHEYDLDRAMGRTSFVMAVHEAVGKAKATLNERKKERP